MLIRWEVDIIDVGDVDLLFLLINEFEMFREGDWDDLLEDD